MSKVDVQYEDEVFALHELVSQLDMLTPDDVDDVMEVVGDAARRLGRIKKLLRYSEE